MVTDEVVSTPPAVKKDGLLLCIFIHGFKGTDSSFADFPARLAHILESTISHLQSECIVFPAYETKGELHQATDRFVDWLTTLTVEKEVAQGLGGGAGKARIIICSHSMGGLLAADACLALSRSRVDDKAPIWPNVIALISFDTPYLGLHPWVFKNTASKAIEYVQTARSVAASLGFLSGGGGGTKSNPSTPRSGSPLPIAPAPTADTPSGGARSWTRLLTPTAGYTVGGVLLATAAAGTAYARRQDIGSGVTWAQDHMKYVGNLWDEKKLGDRVESLIKLSKESSEGGEGIVFRNFYTLLPASPPTHPSPRTFIILPKPRSKSTSPAAAKQLDPSAYFLAATNTIAEDEVGAHTGMFDPKTNDGYYELGLGVLEIVRSALGETPLSEAAADDVVGKEHEAQEQEEKEQGAEGGHLAPVQTVGGEGGEAPAGKEDAVGQKDVESEGAPEADLMEF